MYPFRYCTVADIKSYSSVVEGDDVILEKIELWSSVINSYTGKVFVPIYYNDEYEQLYDDRFVMGDFVSILEMSSPVVVPFSRRELSDVPFTSSSSIVDGSYPLMEDPSIIYTMVDVTGFFGNISKIRAKISTTVVGSHAIGSDSLSLDSTVGVTEGQILLIDNYVTAIVTAVCDNNIVKVDAIASEVLDGDSVVIYGKINRDIVYCMQELVIKKGFGLDAQNELRFQQSLVMEKTDAYMYKLGEVPKPYSVGTGILEVDRILERYREHVSLRMI